MQSKNSPEKRINRGSQESRKCHQVNVDVPEAATMLDWHD